MMIRRFRKFSQIFYLIFFSWRMNSRLHLQSRPSPTKNTVGEGRLRSRCCGFNRHATRRSLQILVVFLPMLFAMRIMAQESALISSHSTAVSHFGQALTFDLIAEADAPITQASLFFRAEGMDDTFTVDLPIATADNVIALTYTADLADIHLDPFTTIRYWWRLQTAVGDTIDIPPQTLRYEDDRFVWQTMSDDNATVHWVGDGAAMGQLALDIVGESTPKLATVFQATATTTPLDLYIYPTAADLRAALQLNGQDWVGAHADPALGVMLLSAANSRTAAADLRQAIPHEMSHHALYQTAPYAQFPVWFDEGLASTMESVPDAGYGVVMETAVANETLIPIADLCHAFPTNAEQTILAYAESASFVRYIQTTYGDDGNGRLIAAYGDGADCFSGVERALGVSLAEVEAGWLHESEPQSPLSIAWKQSRLWLLLLAGGGLLSLLLTRK